MSYETTNEIIFALACAGVINAVMLALNVWLFKTTKDLADQAEKAIEESEKAIEESERW